MNNELVLELYERVKNLENRVAKLEGKEVPETKSNLNAEPKISNKYRKLTKYLLSCNKSEIVLTFSEINDILGFELPNSAYVHREFWANTDRPIANGWMAAGYKVFSVSLQDEEVEFGKV